MKRHTATLTCVVLLGCVVLGSSPPQAQGVNNAPRNGCSLLPSWDEFKAALTAATAAPNGLLRNHGAGKYGLADGRDVPARSVTQLADPLRRPAGRN